VVRKSKKKGLPGYATEATSSQATAKTKHALLILDRCKRVADILIDAQILVLLSELIGAATLGRNQIWASATGPTTSRSSR